MPGKKWLPGVNISWEIMTGELVNKVFFKGVFIYGDTGMADQQKTLSFISSRDHSQSFLPSKITDHAARRVWACAGSELRLRCRRLCGSNNHCTTAPQFQLLNHFCFQNNSAFFSYKSEEIELILFLQSCIIQFLVCQVCLNLLFSQSY